MSDRQQVSAKGIAAVTGATSGIGWATVSRLVESGMRGRSISQAIENALAGDTIMVGAGRYGDLSGDGNFDSPGSEHPQTLRYSRAGNGCVVCITKPVQLYSYGGTSATIIEGASGFSAVVSIMNDNVPPTF
jgi:hypothetical protein